MPPRPLRTTGLQMAPSPVSLKAPATALHGEKENTKTKATGSTAVCPSNTYTHQTEYRQYEHAASARRDENRRGPDRTVQRAR